MLGVALALKDRGHHVTFLVNGYFREAVESCGIDFEELGTRDEFLQSAANPDLWNPLKAFAHIYHSLVEPSLRRQYEVFAERFRTGQAIGITNCFGFGAFVAQDKWNMPVVTLHNQPAVIWSNIEPPLVAGVIGPRWMKRLQYDFGERLFIDRVVGPSLNAFRAELKLPPVRRTTRWWHSRWCVACTFPAWFAAPQADWPQNLVQTDFPLWDERSDDRMGQAVEDFLQAGEPPLVFTPGSSNRFGEKFFKAAVEACRLLDRRGILLSRFPEQIPDALPQRVAHLDYAPFSLLLDRAAALVHHGGIGSVAQAMAAGIPQLCMPLAHDQFDNAARVKRLGVGDWLKPEHFTGPRVATKLRMLLSSNATTAACREIAARLSERNGAGLTAIAIERRAAADGVGLSE